MDLSSRFSQLDIQLIGESVNEGEHNKFKLAVEDERVEFQECSEEKVESDDPEDAAIPVNKETRAHAATQIQQFFRSVQRSVARKLSKEQAAHALAVLAKPDATHSELSSLKHLQETQNKILALTPGYLQWLFAKDNEAGWASGWTGAPASQTFEGAVIYLQIDGLTEFAQRVTQTRRGQDVTVFDSNKGETAQLRRMGISVEVISRYWGFLMTQIRTFQGDVVKILDDAVQVIFPVSPLFTHHSKPHLARGRCQGRGLLFVLDLLHKLNSFEIDNGVFAKDHTNLKVGLAFGKAKIHVLGSSARYDIMLTGETPAAAADLCARAVGTEAVVHESIADIKDRVLPDASFVHMRMDGKQPTTRELYERLFKARDHKKLNQTETPYRMGSSRLGRGLSDNASTQDRVDVLASRRNSQASKTASFRTLASLPSKDYAGYPPDLRNAVQSPQDQARTGWQNAMGWSAQGLDPGASAQSDDFALLARFIPERVLVELMSGCFTSQLDTGHLTILTIIVDSTGTNPLLNMTDARHMNVAFTIVQHVVRAFLGDFLQAWIDTRGLVMVASFGNSGLEMERAGFEAALKARAMLRAEGLKVGMGLSTGICKLGFIGAPFRVGFSVLGSVSRLSARLAERATSVWTLPNADAAVMILDQMSFRRMPESLKVRFVVSEIFLRGFDNTLQIFVPVDGDESLVSMSKQEIFSSLTFISEPRLVKVADAAAQADKDNRWGRQARGIAADVSRFVVGVDRTETIQLVLKCIAVMSVVSPRIDTNIIYELMPMNLVQDVPFVIEALQKKILLLRHVHKQSFAISEEDTQLRLLYNSLLPSYRMELHQRLAGLYSDQLTLGTLPEMPKPSLQIIIGKHYSLAGADHHLDACNCLNQGVSSVSAFDPIYGSQLASWSYKLANSWLNVQTDKAENTAAKAQFLIGKMERKLGNLQNSFNAFVACLRCYTELLPLLHEPCKSLDKCSLEEGTLDTCDCYRLKTNLRATLFIHHAADPYSAFQFRCLEIAIHHNAFLVTPVDCALLGTFEQTSDQSINCRMEEISAADVADRYRLKRQRLLKNDLFRIVITHRQTTQLILDSFVQLASITLKAKALEFVHDFFRSPTATKIISSKAEDTEDAEDAGDAENADEEAILIVKHSTMCALQ